MLLPRVSAKVSITDKISFLVSERRAWNFQKNVEVRKRYKIIT
jgi:hypothetical protein